MAPQGWDGPALMAEFATADRLLPAARQLRELGYSELEFYSPFPVPGADELLGFRRPRIARVVLAAGLAGAVLAVAVQWFANAWDYPLNVGGRPLLSLPAWVPIAFELTILSAAFAAFFDVLVAAGLPRYWHPVFEIDGFQRTTADRFWIGIGAGDPRFDPIRSRTDLERLGALRIVAPEDVA